MNDGNGWDKYQMLVLSELERLNGCFETLDTKLDDAKLEIATLRVKAGIWGLMGASIPSAIAIIVILIRTVA